MSAVRQMHVVNLCTSLDTSRYRQKLVIGSESAEEGSMLDYALDRGVKPDCLPEMVTAFSLTPRDAKALMKLFALIRRERPDIVHTHTAKAGFLGRIAARAAGVRVIVHTYHGHVLHGYYGPVRNWLLRRMERSLGWISSGLIAVSEQVKNDLVDYGIADVEKISVVPLGFNLDPFLNSAVLRGAFKREIRLQPEHQLIGIVGRLFPVKNHRLFLRAAALVSSQVPMARFVIIGDGILRASLEQQARELGVSERVLFTGLRRSLPRIYADLDVLAVSSDNEGTPVSAIEAIASGCPVVATRVGGLPDLIKDHKTGLLVPPRDADALASAVLDLLHNPPTARELGHNAREFVRRRFTVERLITDVDRLYGKLLREKDAGASATERLAARG